MQGGAKGALENVHSFCDFLRIEGLPNVDIGLTAGLTLTCEQGEGPVHLIGSHCIDYFASMDGEADTEDEDDEMEVCEV